MRRFTDIDIEQLAKDMEICDRVFVYGTLQKGHSNHSLLSTSDRLGSTQTIEPFVLGDIGFPYAFLRTKVPEEYNHLLFPVKGEVYKLDGLHTFEGLDMLEGYPSHYNRRMVTTKLGVPAWMYMQDDWGTAEYCSACHLKEGVWQWAK